MKVPARYWHSEGRAVRCQLCPNRCLISAGRRGKCRGRENIDGRLYAVNYGQVISAVVDPIEKKPLYHFLPGSSILSIATFGCNLRCPFCQNWEISQREVPGRAVSPDELVASARSSSGIGVAFTYTEPLVWFEYLMDCCPKLKAAGLRTVLVTNGMVNIKPLQELLSYIDAMNIDLKASRADFYQDYVHGCLDSVLETIAVASGRCHVEVTNLLIPGRNDSDDDISRLTDFLAGLGRDTVLHFSRYFPMNHAREPVTPEETLYRAGEIARERLDYVYLGNLSVGPDWRDTFCPNCGQRLVDRSGYRGRVVGVVAGACIGCGRQADLVIA